MVPSCKTSQHWLLEALISLNVSQVGSCKREPELQYFHGKSYFCLDVTAGSGEKGKAAVTQIRRFAGLPVRPCSTGRSSSTQADISGKNRKIHINCARQGMASARSRSEGAQAGGWVGARGDHSDAQLSPRCHSSCRKTPSKMHMEVS